MAPPTFNFGKAVAFTGLPPSPEEQLQQQKELEKQQKHEIRQLNVELVAARSALAEAGARVMVERTARATAEAEAAKQRKTAETARGVLDTVLPKSSPAAKKMADDYERIVQLQAEYDELRREHNQIKKELVEKEGKVNEAARANARHETELEEARKRVASLLVQLSDSKKDLNDEKTSGRNLESHLQKTYADLEAEKTERKAGLRAKDEVEAKLTETELELQSLHKQWEETQSELDKTNAQLSSALDLERANAGLKEDLESLRGQYEHRERTIVVKDARISHLEAQYQKALSNHLKTVEGSTDQPNAEPNAEPSAEPNALPAIQNLDAELEEEGFSGPEEDDGFYEQLDISDVTEVAVFEPAEPVKAPTLVSSGIQTISVSPVVPHLITSGTQTAAPNLTATLVDVTVETVPVEPQIPSSTTSITQTDPPALVASATQTDTLKYSMIGTQTSTIATANSGTQCDTPKLVESEMQTKASNLASSGTQTHTPELVTSKIQTEASKLASSETQTQIPELTASGIQTETSKLVASETQTQSPVLGMAPIQSVNIASVDANVKPVISPKATEEPANEKTNVAYSTASAGTQTTSTTRRDASVGTETTFEIVEPYVPTVRRLASRWNNFSLLMAFLAAIVAITYGYLMIKVSSLQAANGIGHYHHYNRYDHGPFSGPFGNCRYILGIFPLACDIGHDYYSELFAKYASELIFRFETYFDIVPKVLA